MEGKETVHVSLTEDEAYEILSRCVSHEDEDNLVFQNALHKLTHAIKRSSLKAA